MNALLLADTKAKKVRFSQNLFLLKNLGAKRASNLMELKNGFGKRRKFESCGKNKQN